MKHQAKDLFALQSELIDMKVDMAVSKAIEGVITQIKDLRSEIHTDFQELNSVVNTRFSLLDNRMTAVETKLGIGDERKKEIRTIFIDYVFKAGWLFLAAIISFALIHLHLV